MGLSQTKAGRLGVRSAGWLPEWDDETARRRVWAAPQTRFVFTFRDSGLPGDRVSELLARGLPALLEPASGHLLRMFASVDLAAAGADTLLERRLAVARAVRFEQVVSPSEGWTVASAALQLEKASASARTSTSRR